MNLGLKDKVIMVAASYVSGETFVIDGGKMRTVW